MILRLAWIGLQIWGAKKAVEAVTENVVLKKKSQDYETTIRVLRGMTSLDTPPPVPTEREDDRFEGVSLYEIRSPPRF